ncbi:helix-turn-helix transcriptional regulator [Thiolapillus sp.]|uniref:helix-turn-helix transcriptional regulator n=1 Tax=Thiolapillus sp. TaxID=2017437 RepID=UPI003AF4A12B
MSRKSERRKAAAAQRAAAAQAAATQTIQWRTTQETLAMAQISRTKLHHAAKAGTFPRPIKLGKKCVWIESEIKDWTMKKYNKQ